MGRVNVTIAEIRTTLDAVETATKTKDGEQVVTVNIDNEGLNILWRREGD
jgi:hypothetical protein